RGKNVLDLSNCTLLPGLVDSHTHLAMSGTDDQEIRQRQLIAPFEEIKDMISRHLGEQIKHGIVALRDGGDRAGHVLRYRLNIPQGATPVSFKTAGRAWHAEGRYGNLIGRSPLKGQSLARSILREHAGIDHIKIVNSGLNSLSCFGKETPPQFDFEQLKEAVKTGLSLGLKTMVHANGAEPVRSAIEAGCNSIEHGFFMGDDNLLKMADKRITWVPTLFTMESYSRIFRHGSTEYEVTTRNLYHQIDQVSKAAKYGVPIAVGTDAGSPGVHHGKAIREEIKLLISSGLSLEKAVKSATFRGARLLGMEDRIGTLTVGMQATFISTFGGPEALPDALDSPESIWVRGRTWQNNPS
ncbi:MAG: amidohydrolase family protein, partial [Deltaproteobacteria bacterium]|nr:amidohydrolase family protein [Deltaproteobacteria bacterium]